MCSRKIPAGHVQNFFAHSKHSTYLCFLCFETIFDNFAFQKWWGQKVTLIFVDTYWQLYAMIKIKASRPSFTYFCS